MAALHPQKKPRRTSRPQLADPTHSEDLAGLWRHAMSSWAGAGHSHAQLVRSARFGIDGLLERALLSGCVLGVRHRDEWVGMVLLDLAQAELHGPFVAPDWQGQGVGRRLVTAAERRSVDFQLFRLAVHAFLPTRSFFQACGYETLEGTRPERQAGAGLEVLTLRRQFPRRQVAYGRRISTLNQELGLPADYGRRRALPLQLEAPALVSAGHDCFERPQQMTPGTLEAWIRMRDAASDDGVTLELVSAYRSVDYQAAIIRRKRDAGQAVAKILAVSAAPGYSEHHTGRALDLSTPGSDPLERAFEDTDAFRWLQEQAGSFGFRLSFPEDNIHGIAYEPWHWCYGDR